MKKNHIWIFIAIILIIAAIIGIYIYANSNNTNPTPDTNNYGSRISTTINNQNTNNQTSNSYAENINKEKEISSFSTTIKDQEPGRLTNITLTCSTLNNTIVEAGSTFSFNEVIGQPTTERGYQEASIIIDHKTERGIGGGNCQVSSTLYNAVLAIPSLVVVERHEHGKDVTYVPDGKDAAVSYGSVDFKFRNESGKNIRIEALTDNQTITIKLIEL